jgi:hypothetical protein
METLVYLMSQNQGYRLTLKPSLSDAKDLNKVAGKTQNFEIYARNSANYRL